ncbi:MAG: right-handed parallel beta-helix repeat-containing protein, partial [Geminicoccaceae bacterium]
THRLRCGAPGALGLLVLAAQPALAVECGEVVTSSARLDRDLVCTTDPALTVDGGSLNLNGFTIVCGQTGDQSGVGVLLEGTGARLRNGAVTGCELAVWVAGAGNHRIERLTASAANQGVFVESDGNRLSRSNVLRGLNDAAVQVNGSNNRLQFNNIAGSTDQGFEINGNDNRIVGNRIGGVAEGVQLAGDGNLVSRNDIIGATDRGVEVRAGAHVIEDNLIADGTADGIAVILDANGNEVSRNAIFGNADQGLFVSTLENRLERNRVLLNGVDLTDATANCDDNLWRDNIFETSVSDDCVD